MADNTRVAMGRLQIVPEKLDIPTPPIGGKFICLERLGKFILQEGPGVFRCIACTHGGSAYMTIWDGLDADPRMGDRPVFMMRPAVLGHWMLDLGFVKGLTVELEGGMVPLTTIVWIEKAKREASAESRSEIQNKSAA